MRDRRVSGYYAAKFERESKDNPMDWMVVPSRGGFKVENVASRWVVKWIDRNNQNQTSIVTARTRQLALLEVSENPEFLTWTAALGGSDDH